jgi:acyl carrier protein|tara:strand:+ start:945 stop:1184 length:240 start_codon:yes stop_codon:yes gene_type:complete
MTELDFETKLKKILKKVFEIDEINLNYSMDDIPEWDSFKHILLLTKIEKEFNIKFEVSDFIEMRSIPIIKSKILKYLNE